MDEQAVKQQALVPIVEPEVASQITRMVMELPRGVDLGASDRYMIEMVQRHSLTLEDVAEVILICKDFGAKVGYINRFLGWGVPLAHVHAAYVARDAMGGSEVHWKHDELSQTSHPVYSGISLVRVIEFLDCFPELLIDTGGDPEAFGNVLTEVCDRVQDESEWVADDDAALRFLCRIARENENVSLEGAIALLVGGQFSFLDGVQNEEDE